LISAILAEPFIPSLSHKIIDRLNYRDTLRIPEDFKILLKEGHKIQDATPNDHLGKEITDEQVEFFRKKFSGKESFLLDLRAAKLISVKEHSTADRLFIVEADIGKEKRTLVAGLREFYKKEDLEGKTVVVCCNLKQTTIQGVKSQAMILAAKGKKGLRVLEINNTPPGTQISNTMLNVTPKPAMDYKKDFLEVKLTIGEEGIPYFFKGENKYALHTAELLNCPIVYPRAIETEPGDPIA